jgi:hypothetical protein
MKSILYILGLLVTSVCLANVIRVPEDYQDINDAFDFSSQSDTIQIAGGEHLMSRDSFIMHGISIIGEIDSFGHVLTTIVCSGENRTKLHVYASYSRVNIENIDFISTGSENRISIDIANGSDTLFVNNCTFVGFSSGVALSSHNHTVIKSLYYDGYYPGEYYMGNFTTSSTELDVSNCIFRNVGGYLFESMNGSNIKSTLFYGNPFFRSSNDISKIDNCTFYGISHTMQIQSAEIINCIFWGIQTANGVYLSQGNTSIGNCVVQGGADAIFNYGSFGYNFTGPILDFDPIFNDYLHLTQGSPCIDAGDPSSPLDPDGTRADIGAYYYCQGEGIHIPDIVRTSTEPGYPEPIVATLQSTCDAVVIDSARTSTGLFTLDSYPTQIAKDYSTGIFQMTFNPTQQGLYADTLHIWANTDPPHHKIPLVGESGPIPAPVTDLSISILPDLSARLTWSPVTQTIYGNPVTPDYYLIFYSELDPQVEEEWYYLTPVVATTYTHQLVARFRNLMNYRVVAWKGIDPALLGWKTGMKMIELEPLMETKSEGISR